MGNEKYNRKMYKRLEELASAGKTDYYSRFGKRFGYHGRSRALAEELGKCSDYSHKKYGLMITALITRKGTNNPGEGFFWCANTLGENVGRSNFNKGLFIAKQQYGIFAKYQNRRP